MSSAIRPAITKPTEPVGPYKIQKRDNAEDVIETKVVLTREAKQKKNVLMPGVGKCIGDLNSSNKLATTNVTVLRPG